MKLKLFFIALILPTLLFSQGAFLDKDSSGVGFNFNYVTQNEASGFGLSGMILVNGFLDLGIGFARVVSSGEDNTTAMAIGPSLALNLINSKILSFSVGLSYAKSSYSSDFLDYHDLKMSGNSLGISGQFFGKFVLNPNIKIIPSLGINYSSMTVELSDGHGNSIDDDDENVSFMIGTSLLFKFNSGQLFYLLPGVVFDENNSAFNISMGFILPTNIH